MKPFREIAHCRLPIVEVALEEEIVGKGRQTEVVLGRDLSLTELPLLHGPRISIRLNKRGNDVVKLTMLSLLKDL